MTIDPEEAAAALHSIDRTRRHAGELRNYAAGGNILIVWGLVWVAANLATQFHPEYGKAAWGVSIPIAVIWSAFQGHGGKSDGRIVLTAIAGVCLLPILQLMIGIHDPRLSTALASLLVGVIYVVSGIWIGVRYAWLGLFLVGAVLVGWFAMPQWLYLMLALGGVALIVNGLWWRRA